MEENNIEIATLGNGCFWCTEAVFQNVKGVIKVESGYSGGDTINPTYKDICTGSTNHAECLQITFDNKVVSYDDILKIFWETHDPTTPNRQGNDVGTQYRSIAFYRNETEKKSIDDYIATLSKSGSYSKKIAVEVTAYTFFVKAEDYHQNYVQLHPESGYVQGESLPRKKRTLAQVKDLLK